jgi:hypothetical protein
VLRGALERGVVEREGLRLGRDVEFDLRAERMPRAGSPLCRRRTNQSADMNGIVKGILCKAVEAALDARRQPPR